jgi:hypothetical protein
VDAGVLFFCRTRLGYVVDQAGPFAFEFSTKLRVGAQEFHLEVQAASLAPHDELRNV